MQEENSMEEDREKMAQLKQLVQDGAYVVDANAVAGAILRRVYGLEPVREHEATGEPDLGEGQITCSYPASAVPASLNTTPPGPSITLPIQLRLRLGARVASSFSMLARALAGTHTQSS